MFNYVFKEGVGNRNKYRERKIKCRLTKMYSLPILPVTKIYFVLLCSDFR